MHDTLNYMSHEPVYRQYHHDQLTFGLMYAFSEKFLLPFSHDEVVHGKYSPAGQDAGDEWQRFANLRLLYTYLSPTPAPSCCSWAELAEPGGMASPGQLSWELSSGPHTGRAATGGDLNRLYRAEPSLYRKTASMPPVSSGSTAMIPPSRC